MDAYFRGLRVIPGSPSGGATCSTGSRPAGWTCVSPWIWRCNAAAGARRSCRGAGLARRPQRRDPGVASTRVRRQPDRDGLGSDRRRSRLPCSTAPPWAVTRGNTWWEALLPGGDFYGRPATLVPLVRLPGGGELSKGRLQPPAGRPAGSRHQQRRRDARPQPGTGCQDAAADGRLSRLSRPRSKYFPNRRQTRSARPARWQISICGRSRGWRASDPTNPSPGMQAAAPRLDREAPGAGSLVGRR